ncbi:MAG: ABC transporter permease [Rhodothermales bacterium]
MPAHSVPPSRPLATLFAFWRREVLKFVRDRSRVVGAFAQPLLFWLLLGFGFRASFAMPGVADQSYLMFLFPGILMLVVLFTAIFSTISVVEERKNGFLQAALVAPISRVLFVLGNTLGGTTLALAQALLFLLALPLIGVVPSLSGMLLAMGILALSGIGFTALGVLIAWRMETTRGFHAVMNLVLLPLWFLSGAAFPVEGAAPALQWAMRLNPVSYAVSALREALYGTGTAEALASPLVALVVTIGFAVAMLALAARAVRRPVFG